MDPRLEMIFARRSVRKYTPESLSEQEIRALLEAGMAAPSAVNYRPWHLVTVTDRAKLKSMADAHPYGKMTAKAALAIAVCGDPAVSPRHWVQDCSAVTENILIAATGLGLGAVWLGCYPNEEREAAIRRVLQIPEHIRVLSLVPVGRPAEFPPARTQYDPDRDHRDSW